jgi:hypothetical protein
MPSFDNDKSFEPQPSTIAEAKAELELYNVKWIEVQKSLADSTTPSQPQQVPWRTSSSKKLDNPDGRQDWKLIA